MFDHQKKEKMINKGIEIQSHNAKERIFNFPSNFFIEESTKKNCFCLKQHIFFCAAVVAYVAKNK